MKTDIEMFVESEALIKKYVPSWKVIEKSTSLLHKIIGVFLTILTLGSLKYMKGFWTTIGYTTAYPPDSEDHWWVLCHEGKHGIQSKKWTLPLFGYLYLFPQLFLPVVAAALGFFVSPWFYIGTILAVAPLPAPWRMWWELDALRVTMSIYAWEGRDMDRIIDSYVSVFFMSSNYFFMWPFRGWVTKQLWLSVIKARDWENVVDKDPYLDDIYRMMQQGYRLRLPRKKGTDG